jgi:hypothetical protein
MFGAGRTTPPKGPTVGLRLGRHSPGPIPTARRPQPSSSRGLHHPILFGTPRIELSPEQPSLEVIPPGSLGFPERILKLAQFLAFKGRVNGELRIMFSRPDLGMELSNPRLVSRGGEFDERCRDPNSR